MEKRKETGTPHQTETGKFEGIGHDHPLNFIQIFERHFVKGKERGKEKENVSVNENVKETGNETENGKEIGIVTEIGNIGDLLNPQNHMMKDDEVGHVIDLVRGILLVEEVVVSGRETEAGVMRETEVEKEVEVETGVLTEVEIGAETGVQTGAETGVGTDLETEVGKEAETEVEIEAEIVTGVEIEVEKETEVGKKTGVEREKEVGKGVGTGVCHLLQTTVICGILVIPVIQGFPENLEKVQGNQKTTGSERGRWKDRD